MRPPPRWATSSPTAGRTAQDWPYKNVRTPLPVKYSGSAPIVVVGTTGDPATPVEWAGELRKQLGNASLVTFKGEGHTAYGRSNSCVTNAVEGISWPEGPADNTEC